MKNAVLKDICGWVEAETKTKCGSDLGVSAAALKAYAAYNFEVLSRPGMGDNLVMKPFMIP